jgi:cell division initiation protein
MHRVEVPGLVDDISPSSIRRQRFEMVRRGFDPQEVGAFLERVAERLALAERAMEEAEARLSSTASELDEARAAEEALQLTMVAATQAKDEMLARAKTEAEEVRAAAQREAETVVTEARRQASGLVDDSRRDAGGVVDLARGQHAELLGHVDELREVVARVRQMLSSVAGNIDPVLDRAERLLDDPSAIHELDEPIHRPEPTPPPATGIVFEAEPSGAVRAETAQQAHEDEPEEQPNEAYAEPSVTSFEAAADDDADDEPAATPEVEPADEPDGEEPDEVAPPSLEIVADIADDADADQQDAQEFDGEGHDGEAAEVERLLRQLRGG